MQKERYSIGQGPSECFLIFDEALGIHTTFYDYLKSEGFTRVYPSYGSCDRKYCYVNITRRQYEYGKFGIPLTLPIGNTSITIEEFRTIWGIYKKHLDAGECFSYKDEPYIYQSPAVIEKRRKQEERKREMEEMRKKAEPATPEEVEALVREFPEEERMIRGLAAKVETASVIRGCAEVSEWF